MIGVELCPRPLGHGGQGFGKFCLVVLIVSDGGRDDNAVPGGQRLHEPARSRRGHPEDLLAAAQVAKELAELLFRKVTAGKVKVRMLAVIIRVAQKEYPDSIGRL